MNIKKGLAVVACTAILTAIISGVLCFKFPVIAGAHALNTAFWAVWSITVINFIGGAR